LPVFALGRAQELLLILEEYWRAHPELHEVQIYYPCALAAKSMIIFQTYFNMMGMKVQDEYKKGRNPFQFRFIETLNKLDGEENKDEPCVIMTSPGMLQNGLSREIFEKWCHDDKNGVLLTGYCVKGTLAEVKFSQYLFIL
jgi:cleavage and polyadenylation specificity factor subunit 3